MGVPLTFAEDAGPRLEAVTDAAGIDALRIPDPEADLGYVLDAIRLIRGALGGKVPLLGFAGAPFTLLTYIVEGQTGKQFIATKRLLFGAPEVAHRLLGKLTETVIRFLSAQIAAGAQAVQIFDSWVGQLGPEDFRTFAAPYVARIVAALRPLGAPIIYFANDGATLLGDAAKLGADALAVDWRVPIAEARARAGAGLTLQGNLDPCALFAPTPEIERRVRGILDATRGTRHVFNLGHGILPPTEPAKAEALVEMVHRLGAAV